MGRRVVPTEGSLADIEIILCIHVNIYARLAAYKLFLSLPLKVISLLYLAFKFPVEDS